MAGWIGSQPKIIRRRHQTSTKMMEPEAVHHHPGCEGIVPAGDRFGQIKSAAAMGEGLSFVPSQNRKKLARNFYTQSIRVPTDEDSAVLRLRTVHERHRPLGSAGMRGVQASNFCLEWPQLRERRCGKQLLHQLSRQVTRA